MIRTGKLPHCRTVDRRLREHVREPPRFGDAAGLGSNLVAFRHGRVRCHGPERQPAWQHRNALEEVTCAGLRRGAPPTNLRCLDGRHPSSLLSADVSATTITTKSEVSNETRTSSAPEIGSRPTTRFGRSSQNRRSGRIRQFVDVRTAALPGDARRTICPAERAVAGNLAAGRRPPGNPHRSGDGDRKGTPRHLRSRRRTPHTRPAGEGAGHRRSDQRRPHDRRYEHRLVHRRTPGHRRHPSRSRPLPRRDAGSSMPCGGRTR